MDLLVDRLASPLGSVWLVADAEGCLRALDFADCEARLRRLLGLHYGRGRFSLSPGRAPAAIRERIGAYFAGELAALDAIPVRTGGTAFQRSVWAALRGLRAGATDSYGNLAAAIGRPSASRAVGLANGANPIAIVVPCHRVIGRSGALTGYAGGLARKRWLLAHEGALAS